MSTAVESDFLKLRCQLKFTLSQFPLNSLYHSVFPSSARKYVN